MDNERRVPRFAGSVTILDGPMIGREGRLIGRRGGRTVFDLPAEISPRGFIRVSLPDDEVSHG